MAWRISTITSSSRSRSSGYCSSRCGRTAKVPHPQAIQGRMTAQRRAAQKPRTAQTREAAERQGTARRRNPADKGRPTRNAGKKRRKTAAKEPQKSHGRAAAKAPRKTPWKAPPCFLPRIFFPHRKQRDGDPVAEKQGMARGGILPSAVPLFIIPCFGPGCKQKRKKPGG